MARLKLVRDGVEIQTAELQSDGFVIGRSDACDMQINDRAVGREHAVISAAAGVFSLSRKSKFGKLLVNGVDPGVETVSVKPGDVISIADYLLQVEETKTLQRPIEKVSDVVSTVETVVASESIAAPSVSLAIETKTEEKSTSEKTAESSAGQDFAMPSFSLEQPSTSDPQVEQVSVDLQGMQDGKTSVAIDSAALDGAQLQDISQAQTPGQGFDAGMDSGFGGGDRTAIVSTEALEAKLVLPPGAANVEELKIEKSEIVIGRGNACDIVLNDKSASRRHCIVRKVGAQFILEDLGSGNGTLVNGEKVDRHELSGDDVIQVADTEFRFVAGSVEYGQQQGEFIPVDDSDPNASQNGGGSDFEQQSYDPHALAAEQTPQGFGVPGAIPGGIPGVGGGTFGGIPGINTGPPKKETLLEKFKRQPKPRQLMIVAAIGLVVLLSLEGEDPKKKVNTKKGAQVTDKVSATFNALPAEKKQFVTNTYQLAMDLYKNQEYEKSLFEITKVLDILPDGYKDSKDVKRYAEIAIERERSKLDEKKKKEDRERIEREVADFVKQLEDAIAKTDEATARDLFNKIFERDPENATALRLKQELDDRIAFNRKKEEEARDLEDKKKRLADLISEGRRLLKEEKYYEVMSRMLDAPTIGYNDAKMLAKAKGLITEARKMIDDKLAPFLSAGKQALASKDYPKARDSFNEALVIDDSNEEAQRGLAQIRDTLNEKSRALFTEGAFAESNGDYDLAKSKYRECLDQAMPDEIYYDRCLRKTKKFSVEISSAGGMDVSSSRSAASADSGNDPEMPSFPMEENSAGGGKPQ